MGKSIFFLIITIIVTLILLLINYKNKKVKRIINVLSLFFLVLTITTLAIDYDPLKRIIGIVKLTIATEKQNKQMKEPSFEVSIPKNDPSNNVTENNNSEIPTEYIPKATIINIANEAERGEDNKISIIWTPIAEQETYKLKIQAIEPSVDGDLIEEFVCDDNRYSVDTTNYPDDTLIFASVAIYDKESIQWVYSDPIQFTIR